MTKTKTPLESPILYPRDIVFAAACAAQRINGEYVKRADANYGAKYGFRNPKAISTSVESNATKLYNSAIMKILLASDRSDILPEDYSRAEEVRSHFCSMITLIFSGDARDFIKDAIEASVAEEIPNAGKIFGIVASLPSIFEKNTKRSIERATLNEMIAESTPIEGMIEEPVRFNVTVIDSIYKERFGSRAVNVKVNNVSGNHVLFFFDKKEWTKGNKYNISGRIKNKQNQITQLHYVRQLTPNGKEKEI